MEPQYRLVSCGGFLWLQRRLNLPLRVFDSSNDMAVITYRADGNSAYGTAIVGTVSGTSISFGIWQSLLRLALRGDIPRPRLIQF